MTAKLLTIITILVLFPGFDVEAGESYYGTVKRVIDGDSLLVTTGGRNIEVRLYGVDAPEYKQPFAEEAKNFIREWVGWQRVLVQSEYVDSYGRTVAMIVKGDRVLNGDLIEAGLAWVYPRYCHKEICETWTTMEVTARSGEKGLWRDTQPISPWKWKRSGGRY